MKIFSWNCNGSFRDYFKNITDKKSKTYVDADIYVIQECENPRDYRPKYKEYRKIVRDLVGNNYYWVGDIHSKGLGIFAKESVKLKRKKVNGEYKHFMAFRVNDSFNLLCIWAMEPYVEMIHDFFDDNTDLFDEELIICGDFNSNVRWDDEHKALDEDGGKKDHSNLNRKLNEKGLYSVYHGVTGEKPEEELKGESKKKSRVETKNTFFLYRHLNKPDHIDYFYASEDLINKTKWRGERYGERKDLPYEFEILERWQWLSMSDHLPIVWDIHDKKYFKKEYFLHILTQKNFEKLFRLEFVASERPYTISQEEYDQLGLGDIGFDENKSQKEKLKVIPDNIAFDEKTGELVIIEYKNKSDPNVLKQVEKYKRVVKNNPKEFNKRKYDVLGNKLEEPVFFPFDKQNIRTMIIAPEFDPTVKKECPADVELWEVSLWDKCNNGEYEVIYKFDSKNIKKLSIDLGDVELTENDVIENNVPEEMRDEICDLYCSFRKKVKDECDVELIPLSNGVSFRANNQIVCIVYFNKYSIKLHYNTDELDGCERLVKIPKDKKYVGNFELKLNPKDDVGCAFKLFKKVYNEKME